MCLHEILERLVGIAHSPVDVGDAEVLEDSGDGGRIRLVEAVVHGQPRGAFGRMLDRQSEVLALRRRHRLQDIGVGRKAVRDEPPDARRKRPSHLRLEMCNVLERLVLESLGHSVESRVRHEAGHARVACGPKPLVQGLLTALGRLVFQDGVEEADNHHLLGEFRQRLAGFQAAQDFVLDQLVGVEFDAVERDGKRLQPLQCLTAANRVQATRASAQTVGFGLHGPRRGRGRPVGHSVVPVLLIRGGWGWMDVC